MLEIYVHGRVVSGFVDLFPNTKLQMEQLTEIWDEDFGTSVYSLPCELPWTDNNKRIFNFAECLQNDTGIPVQQWRCDVVSDGLPLFYDAVITILEKNGAFIYNRGKTNFTIAGTKGLLGNLIANKTLQQLALGGIIPLEGVSPRYWAWSHMNGGHPQYNYLRFVPVVCEQYIDTSLPDYTTEFLALDTVNNVVINADGSAWDFGRPNPSTPTIVVPSGTKGYNDYRTIPFFKVKFILQSIFSENGFTLTGDFITSTDFDDLLLFNNFSLELYDYTANTDAAYYIIPYNHMPPTLIADFIKAVCGYFNMYPAFLDGRTVELRYRQKRMAARKVVDITNYCAAEFLSQVGATSITNGYTFQYNGGSDSYLGSRVQDITTYTLCGTVAKRTDLDTLDIGRTFTTADIAFVTADNMYYRVTDATSTPVLWDCFSEALGPLVIGNGSNSLQFAIAPLACYVRQNPTTYLQEKQNYVGANMKGSYAVRNWKVVRNSFGLNFFYGRMQTVAGLNQPISFSHNRDAENNAMVPYSLALGGPDGIFTNFFPAWIAIKLKNELVRVNVRLDDKLVKLLADNDFVMIYSVQLMLYKLLADYPVSLNPTAELQAYVL